MAKIKYVGEEAIGRVADYVNAKLTISSTIPQSPESGTIIMYVGADSDPYLQGGVYSYDGTNWSLINLVRTVELTQAEYNLLPTSAKENGAIYFVTDAVVPNSIVEGYYNSADGKFYQESTYTTEIAGEPDAIYIDLGSNTLFRYDGTEFVELSAGGTADLIVKGYYNAADGKFYADDQYTTEIEGNPSKLYIGLNNDTIYRYDATSGEFISIGGGGGSSRDFVGTQAEWDALSSTEKAQYDFINITDDLTKQDYISGHAIIDGTGTEKVQRAGLKFEGFTVADDSTNDLTKVAEIPYTAGKGVEIQNKEISVDSTISTTFTGTRAEWETLTTAEKEQYDIVNITDDPASGELVVVDTIADGNMNPVTSNAVYDALNKGEVSIIADGVKNYKEIFNELFALIDYNKTSDNSYLKTNDSIYRLTGRRSDRYDGMCTQIGSAGFLMYSVVCHATGSSCVQVTIASNNSVTYANLQASVPRSGAVFEFIY